MESNVNPMTAKKPLSEILGVDSCTARRTHIDAEDYLGWHHIPVVDIRYFEADQKYTSIFYPREIVFSEPLRDLEAEFGDMFLRIFRGLLVSAIFIIPEIRYHRTPGTTAYNYWVSVAGFDRQFPVSRKRLRNLQRYFLRQEVQAL